MLSCTILVLIYHLNFNFTEGNHHDKELRILILKNIRNILTYQKLLCNQVDMSDSLSYCRFIKLDINMFHVEFVWQKIKKWSHLSCQYTNLQGKWQVLTKLCHHKRKRNFIHILGWIWEEVKQLFDQGASNYFRSVWNIIDSLMLTFLLTSFTLDAVIPIRLRSALAFHQLNFNVSGEEIIINQLLFCYDVGDKGGYFSVEKLCPSATVGGNVSVRILL